MSKTTTNTNKNKVAQQPPKQIAGASSSGNRQIQKTTPAGTLATAEDAAFLREDARAGMENIGTRDLAIPRLKLLQDLSPECKKRESTYIPGAEAGDIYDSVNDILIKGEEGFEAILVAYRSTYLEFITRIKGGGFVADHGPNPISLLGKVKPGPQGEQMLPNGNELVLVAEYLTQILDPEAGTTAMSLLGMSKSQLKHSRQLNTWATTLKVSDGNGGLFTPAMFYRTYYFKTAPEKNKKNDTWMGYSISPGREVLGLPAPFNGKALYLACREIRKDFEANKIKVQAPAAPDDQPAPDSSEPM